jgi:hypothetical protein
MVTMEERDFHDFRDFELAPYCVCCAWLWMAKTPPW